MTIICHNSAISKTLETAAYSTSYNDDNLNVINNVKKADDAEINTVLPRNKY